ncbi:hypothetical protein TSMEX_009636 [Taenia solium]|eukprot:TsM_001079600 transcript=TsM_001079600 gene=TsM_001079600
MVQCFIRLSQEMVKPPQRASPWRAAVRRTRQASLGYADHFSALQEFEKATQSHLISKTTATKSTDRKNFPLNSALEDNSRISDPVGDVRSNSYARIAEKRRLKISEIQSRERRPLKAMDSLEKARSWTQETLRNSANNVTAVTSRENREALTRMSSGYASEDVNQVTTTKPQSEVVPSMLPGLNRFEDTNMH